MGARVSRSGRLSTPTVLTVDSDSSSGGGVNSREAAASAAAVSSSDQGSIQYMPELCSYEAACRLDRELQSFDASLQRRTSRVLSTLASGVEVRELSFDSLREVTGSLLEMNQEVVKIILECKKDVWKNPVLFDLVEDYFENSLHTLDFCNALEKCLKRARDSQLIIQIALKSFAEEEAQEVGEDGTKQYTKTLEELRLFKAAGDPFTEEFLQMLQSVHSQQLLMLEKLQRRKNKLDKRIKTIQSWRKVSSIIFAVTVTAVLICSVVVAAISAPPVAAALAAGASIPIGSVGRWIDSLLKNYQDTVKLYREVLDSIQVATYITITDLDGIRALVDILEIQIGTLLDNADFALGDVDAVKIAVKDIREKSGLYMKSIEDLGNKADQCSRDIRRARTVVLQRIIRQPM